jgi:hypothetical protein
MLVRVHRLLLHLRIKGFRALHVLLSRPQATRRGKLNDTRAMCSVSRPLVCKL